MKKALIPLALATTLTPLHAALVYTEDFTVGSSSSAGDIGWQFHVGSSASDQSTRIASSGNDTGVNSDLDRFQVKGNNSGVGSANQFLLSTAEPGAVHTVADISTVSSTVGLYRVGFSSSDVTFRIAIQVDGNWFLSDTAETLTPAGVTNNYDNSKTTTLTVDFASESWNTLLFTPTTTLTNSNTTALPQPTATSAVTQYGVYIEQASTAANWIGVDDFQINTVSVPEPGSSSLIGLAGCALLLRKRS
ncbi:PEP-CTERM sorting domain-containing protein [Rubritalea tangerina]|uniref:PEP-CTERM sorting domain-containing protein n=1 Tax=Rubritalea tangerina TaxID=430798 RepID=A0ABW4Z6S1_9BACT